jgi:hypothetical protein
MNSDSIKGKNAMSFSASRPPLSRIALLAAVYAVAYLAAAALDLKTTLMALQRPEASEGNVYASGAAGYDVGRAWLISLGMGILIEGFLLFGALNAGKVADAWLQRPVRSFAKIYINPFAPSVIDRAPLHALAFVLAFPLLRVLASVNNLMIWAGQPAPLGRFIGVVSRATTPTIAFWAVMAPLFYLVTFASAPLAVRVIRWLRSEGASASTAGAAAA